MALVCTPPPWEQQPRAFAPNVLRVPTSLVLACKLPLDVTGVVWGCTLQLWVLPLPTTAFAALRAPTSLVLACKLPLDATGVV